MAIKQIAASGGDYTTVSAWLASLPSTLTGPEIAEVDDFDLVDIIDTFGKTTTAANYLEIRAKSGKEYNIKTGTGARIRNGSGATLPPLTLSGRNVKLTNIGLLDEVGLSAGALAFSGWVAGSGVMIDGCFIRTVRNGTDYAISNTSATNANLTIQNTVVVSPCRSIDLRSATSAKLHNNVFYRTAAQIGVLAGPATEIKNCYSGSTVAGANDFWTGAVPTGGNNASSDATANFGTGNIINLAATAAFTAPATYDFSFPIGSPLKDAGVVIATVTKDIAGTPRPQGITSDIGAFEYEVAGAASTSITATLSNISGSVASKSAPITAIAATLANISGSVSSGSGSLVTTITATLGNISGAVTSVGSTTNGTFTSDVLKDYAGNVLANTALNFVRFYNDTTGALVLNKTGVSTNGSGIVTFSDAALVAGTTYRVDWETAAGSRRMPRKAAA